MSNGFTSDWLRAHDPARYAAVTGVAPGKPRRRRGDGKFALDKAETCKLIAMPGVFVPIRVSNPLNTRKHWRVVSTASKRAREMTVRYCTGYIPVLLPAIVTLTRYGPRSLDVGCGLNASLKPVRDGVADVFGVDDADDRYEWKYQQVRSRVYGVRIEVQAKEQ